MFIFIPPSETKAFPGDADPVDLGSLALPELAPTRKRLRDALARLSRGKAATALETLGISEGQSGELAHNREIAQAPAGPAADVYTGVLYDALDLPTLRHRGLILDHVLIFSGLPRHRLRRLSRSSVRVETSAGRAREPSSAGAASPGTALDSEGGMKINIVERFRHRSRGGRLHLSRKPYDAAGPKRRAGR